VVDVHCADQHTLANNSGRDLDSTEICASGTEVRDASTVFASVATQEIDGHIEGKRERSGTVFSRIPE
jgi:hypothetical protein